MSTILGKVLLDMKLIIAPLDNAELSEKDIAFIDNHNKVMEELIDYILSNEGNRQDIIDSVLGCLNEFMLSVEAGNIINAPVTNSIINNQDGIVRRNKLH